MRIPRTEEGRRVLGTLIQRNISLREVADYWGLSYSHVVACVYGRYKSDRVMKMVEAYLDRRANDDKRDGESLDGSVRDNS